MAKTLTHWLLIALVLSLGFGQLMRLDIYSQTVYVHDILLLALLVLQIPHFFRRDKKIFRPLGLFTASALLGLVVAVPSLGIGTVARSSLYLWRIVAYLLLYFSLKSAKTKIPIRYFVVAGLVSWGIGVVQYFAMPDMRWAKYLGWDDHLNRLIMPHYDPTFSGVILSLWGLMLVELGQFWLAVLAVPAILLTYARNIWVSLAVTGGALVKNKWFVVAACLVLLGGVLLLPKRFGEGTNLLRTYSILSRYYSGLHDLQTLKGVTWVTGVGMNTLPALQPSTSPYLEHATTGDNSYIYLFVTTGILGTFFFLKMIYDIARTTRFRSVWIFFLVASLFNNVLFYPFALLWVLLLETASSSLS